MKPNSKSQTFSFESKLERIASSANYFAVSVPKKISLALSTHGPVPVFAQVNDSPIFLVSLFPVGEGRHYLRVKAEIREAVKIKEGDRVRIQITVRDRTTEISIPKDLMKVRWRVSTLCPSAKRVISFDGLKKPQNPRLVLKES